MSYNDHDYPVGSKVQVEHRSYGQKLDEFTGEVVKVMADEVFVKVENIVQDASGAVPAVGEIAAISSSLTDILTIKRLDK